MKTAARWMVVVPVAMLALGGCGKGGGGDEASEVAAGDAPAVVVPGDADPVASGVDVASLPSGDRARMAAGEFSERLRSRLQAAMQREGLGRAVEVCHSDAPAIADEVMQRFDVRLGRVSTHGRNRNPGNAPGGWQSGVLADFQRDIDGGGDVDEQRFVQTADLPDGVALRVMYGIRTQQICETCHGVEPLPEAAQVIARLYPADRATGYRDGDLRGGLWVEVPSRPGQ
ncbi:c-type heme family protein [Alkalisalibacterium limincola]|uniref:DUF3365 domain-containing protein n=1 Tax=Alkalisalibacterium limincola TaxID=2699169 RepID=A0A5C8KRI3_9GAMM|nr:DUF3365 domain-containing protein [Alkalisalibacterium limincola]TXK62535.1 DUF3365 domain-containing protein [Alkalisalibacterium limincola]